MTNDGFASLFAAFLFAFSSEIWNMAVKTEVYNVNVLFFSLALFLILSWYRKPSKKFLISAAVVFGISLGSYLANLLLVPAFVVLILQSPKDKISSLVLFLMLVALVGGGMLSWSVYRSHTIPPLGTTYLPHKFEDAIRYFTGAQYGSLDVQSSAFILRRVIQHGLSFSRSLFGVGAILGFIGLVYQCKKERPQSIALLLVVVINLGYFTQYKDADYYTMVTPSYFVFSLWISYGISLLSKINRVQLKTALRLISVVVLVVVFLIRLEKRIAVSRSHSITEFCLSSFDKFPKNAIVVSNWGWFPCLLYFQEVHNFREDLLLIEHERDTRHYEHGTIHGHMSYIESIVGSRPVVIDYIDHFMEDQYNIKPIDENWFLVERLGTDFNELH